MQSVSRPVSADRTAYFSDPARFVLYLQEGRGLCDGRMPRQKMTDGMEWTFILRLLVAGLLGTVIGLDREYRVKDAGFRTHFSCHSAARSL